VLWCAAKVKRFFCAILVWASWTNSRFVVRVQHVWRRLGRRFQPLAALLPLPQTVATLEVC
jgi:hypothetical protein